MRKLPTILSILLLFCFATTLNAQITSCGSTTRNFSASLLGGNIAGAQNGFGNVALTFDSGNATVRSSTLGLNNITGITLFRGNPASGGTAVMTFTDFANNFQAGNFSTRFMEEFLAKNNVREMPNVTAPAALTSASA